MSTKKTPTEATLREICAWLKANGHDTAGLTGTDGRTLIALAAIWEVWANTRKTSEIACAATWFFASEFLQRKHWPLAIELVAMKADWCDRDELATAIGCTLADEMDPGADDSDGVFFDELTKGLAVRS